MKTALAIRHVGFEDLGGFTTPIRDAGYAIRYWDVGQSDLLSLAPATVDLLIVLGGPIGAYEDDSYPFLRTEIDVLARRLAEGRPTLGVCLGAQLIARAAGARVYPSGVKEIGFAPITVTDAGRASCLAPFAHDPMTLHWHGDTFDLPEGAELLASTSLCENQAFSLGPPVIGFQFHPEAGAQGIEPWLVGHAAELAAAGIDVSGLRADAELYGARLLHKAKEVANAWLAGLPG